MTEQESMASEDDIVEAKDPTIGTGTPESAPPQKPPASLLERQPATVVGAAVALIDAVLAVVASGAEATTIAVVGGIVIVTMLGAIYIKAKVTPTVDPKLDVDTPLVPVGVVE